MNRKPFVVGIVLSACLVVLTIFLFLGKILDYSIEKFAEEKLNRPVDIAAVSVSYFPLKITIDQVQIIDLKQLDKDLVFIDKLSFELAVLPMVFNRFVINQILVDDIFIHRNRSQSYILSEKEKQSSQAVLNQTSKQTQLNTGINVQRFIDQSNLNLLDFLQRYKKNIHDLRKDVKVKTSVAIKNKLKKAHHEIDILINTDKKMIKKELKKNKQKSTYLKRVHLLGKSTDEWIVLKQDLLNIIDQYSQLDQNVQLAYAADYDFILKEVSDVYKKESTLSELLVSSYIQELLDSFDIHLEAFKHNYSSFLDQYYIAQDYRVDQKGSYVPLRFKGTWPKVAIHSIKINGQSEHSIFDINVINLSSTLFEKGSDFSFSINQSERDEKGVSMYGVGSTIFEQSNARFESHFKLLQQNNSVLDPNRHYIEQVNTVADVSLDYFNSMLDLDIGLRLNDIKFSKQISNVIVRSFLSSINDIGIDFKLFGPFDQLDYSITSTVDQPFSFVFNSLKKDQEEKLKHTLTMLLQEKKENLMNKLNKISMKNEFEVSIKDLILSIDELTQKMADLDKKVAKFR